MDLSEITIIHEGVLKIDARKLYQILGFDKTHYSRWSKKNIENNPFLIENFDWWKIETIDFEEEPNNENSNIEGEQNPETIAIEGEQNTTKIKKEFVLSFDMTLHLLLQNPNEAGFKIRQILINYRKQEIESKRKISELSNINQTDKSEIKELKKQRFNINKRLAFLVQKTENQDNELHFINTGQTSKIETLPKAMQTTLFLE